MSPKVSVIVPVYKVEKYINKCVNSIVNQSYKNLEIILVDDGSPDICGQKLDEYKKVDSRVKVCHKENGGLSSARNYGMKFVTGEYTVFVDSDDWLDLTMIETLLNLAEGNKAEVVQGAFYYAYDKYLLYDDRWFKEDEDIKVLNNKELMKELVINERVKNFAWGKLYKTELIKDIPFEEGALFEDVFWAHEVMAKVNKYVICHKPLCYYLQRDSSTVASYSIRNLDMIRGLEERHKFIIKNYKEFSEESYKSLFKGITQHYEILRKKKELDKDCHYKNQLKFSIESRYDAFEKAFEEDKTLAKQLKAFSKGDTFYKIYRFCNKVNLKLTNRSPKTLNKIDL